MSGPGWHIGIIGGSGLAEGIGLEDAVELAVSSPFGEASGPVVQGRLGDLRLSFLPRHGAGHRIPPGAVNYRANIDVLKRCGVSDVIALSAIGSLNAEMAPGSFVLVDQLIDRTQGRANSFFGPGLVGHVSLAREAELPYALVGMVTDWDCWREAEAGAEASEVIRVMAGNARIALDMLGHFARALPATREPSPIDRALDGAIVTHPAARDPALVARLGAVAGRVLRPASGA